MKADENSDSAFLLVFCTFLSCIALPWSITLLVSLYRSGIRTKDGKLRNCFLINVLINILIWLLIYYIASSVAGEDWMKDFDPYITLGVVKGTSVSKIRKAYRNLSTKWHPDKNPDPEAKKMFFLINKAKDILTDPVKRDNFLKYGNPDGNMGGYKMSIALPTFLFDKNYQLLILGVFAFFLLIVFPCCIYKWFSNSDANSDPETGVSLQNMQLYMKESSKKMKYESIIPLLAKSFEYVEFCKYATKEEVNELNILLNQIPKRVKELHKGSLYLKNVVLIYSHIMNLQMADKDLKRCFDKIRKTAPRQVEFLINRMLEFILLYHHGQFEVLFPINNVYMLIDFLK